MVCYVVVSVYAMVDKNKDVDLFVDFEVVIFLESKAVGDFDLVVCCIR